MKERGVVKVPGCGSIEVDNVLIGYVPDTSLVFHVDMEEAKKEETLSLRYHSEKLAIALPQEQPSVS
ncbi:hypothetical protein IFM89_033003 [Coptis chinensis]|uniref:Uncharacterized protein n=1 Tax=Coptis chinensis TaxID=261450 RepID=A0A835IJS1_9MAGN|nr:hypothetical protein IFM89_033003 [Coptis chinensis]